MEIHENSSEDESFNLITIVSVVGIIVNAHELESMIPREPNWSSTYTDNQYITEVLHVNSSRCFSIMRMTPTVFNDLCTELSTNYGLVESRDIGIREAVGIFVYTLAHGAGNRNVQDRFQHSGETIHRHFHNVLRSIYRMSKVIIKPRDPEFRHIPSKIVNDHRYWPFFRDCIGAIDGTHVPCVVPSTERIQFIGRKGIPTQNVMAVCDFDMLFTFVCARWEGSAHDSRIFQSQIGDANSNFPHPPAGKYYLADAGYPNRRRYLAPYKGERYHLEQYRSNQRLSCPKEAFNYAHSSLWSVIERTFGVLKKKWSILSRIPSYPYSTQVDIVVACMALHNFIRQHVVANPDFSDYSNKGVNLDGDDYNTIPGSSAETAIGLEDMEMRELRDVIATELFGVM